MELDGLLRHEEGLRRLAVGHARGDELGHAPLARRERVRPGQPDAPRTAAGRDELATGEEAEAELISGYLPAELSDEELDGLVAGAIEQTGAESPKDMGKVMGAVMKQVAGRADGRRVQAAVKGKLGA